MRQARGEIIVRVDGHTFIAPDYVRQCVEILQRSGAESVGGRMDAVGTNCFGRAMAVGDQFTFWSGEAARFHISDQEESGSIRSILPPGRGGSSASVLACSTKNWCATRTMSSIIAYALRWKARCSLAKNQIGIQRAQFPSEPLAAVLPVWLLEDPRPAETPVADEPAPVRPAGLRPGVNSLSPASFLPFFLFRPRSPVLHPRSSVLRLGPCPPSSRLSPPSSASWLSFCQRSTCLPT